MSPNNLLNSINLHLPDILDGWGKYRAAVPATRYRLTVGGWKWDYELARKPFAFIWPRKRPGQVGTSPGTLADDVPGELRALLRMQFEKKYDAYVTPISDGNYFYLLVDDLAGEAGLNRLIDAGYRPSWVAETSPGNYQATLIFPRLNPSVDLDRWPSLLELERLAGNKIVREINCRQKFGDPEISGIVHPQRLPGFANAKPHPTNLTGFKYGVEKNDGTWSMWRVRIVRAEFQLCGKTQQMFLDALSAILGKGHRAEARKRIHGGGEGGVTLETSPNAAKLVRWHYADVLKRAKQTALSANWSSVDFMVACRMRVHGFSAGETAYAVSFESRNARPAVAKNKHHNFDRYASDLASIVFALPEDAPEILRLRPYVKFWPPAV